MLEMYSNAMSSVRTFTRGLVVATHNNANIGTKKFAPKNVETTSARSGGVQSKVVEKPNQQKIDLARETAQQISSQRAIQANVEVMRASDKTLGVLLDTIG